MCNTQIATTSAVAAALALLTLDGAFAAPEPCTFYPFDGCRCHTDTVTLDISGYFKYPLEIMDPDGKYMFTYNPCEPFECGSGDPAVLCQRAIGTGEVKALGRLDGNTTWYVESDYPLQFTLHYYNGDPDAQSSYRNALVGMLHDKSSMSAVYISEDPKFTYNFGITGNKVVAEQEICMFEPSESCRCHTNTISLDISEYFEYPVEVKGQDVYSYIYSPCTPIPCGSKLAAVCQVWQSQDVYHVVGILDSSTTWYVTSYNPLQFTIHYFGGEEDRNGIFNVSYENTTMSAKFTSELPLRTYHLSITGNKVLSTPAPGLCTLYPSETCRCHTDTISLDMRDYFTYPVLMPGQDVYDYIFSPCSPIRCGNASATVCQVWQSEEIYHVAGKLDNSTIWYVNSYDPLQFTVRYFGGEEGRNAMFSVSHEDAAMSVKFTSENPLLTYHFDITGNKVVPASGGRVTPRVSQLSQSHTEEEQEEWQEERGGYMRVGFDRLVLLGTVGLLFLILLVPAVTWRRRRSAIVKGYSALPSKEKDILC